MNTMKKISFLLLAGTIGFLSACNSNTSPDSVDSAKEANKEKDSSVTEPYYENYKTDTTVAGPILPVDKDAANFAVDVANGGMMEIELGNYAQQNAADDRVKAFGAMMAKDHTLANNELQAIASSKNITLPASIGNDTKKEIEKLMKKTGKDFDKAYMSMMLDDHKKDVSAFEKNAKECKDTAIKKFAIKTLPVLKVHLDSAKAITGKK